MADFKDIIHQVKSHVFIEETIESSGVLLRPSGYRLKGLCPFHQEKTPSFMVDPQTQTYRCYGCGEHGDVINYVMSQQQLSFTEALLMLAEDCGVEVPNDFTKDESGQRIDYAVLRDIIKSTANHFYKNFVDLDESHPAKQEIRRRGLSLNKGLLYGYASEKSKDLYYFLKSKNFSDDAIEATGVCRSSEHGFYDFWRGRLMFFITDVAGRPVGFSGRLLREADKGGKYVNSVDSPVFNKSRVLYNIDKAKSSIVEKKEAYVVEGQFDVAALVEAGIENVVAASGTAFTTEQANILSRMTDNGQLIFCFDGDSAGTKAAFKAFENNPEIHLQSMIVFMEQGMDPCDCRQAYGDDGLRAYLKENKVPIVDFMLDLLESRCDMNSEQGRNEFYRRSIVILSKIADPLLLKNAVRKVALKSLAEVSDIYNKVVDEKKQSGRYETASNRTKESSNRPDVHGGELDDKLCDDLKEKRDVLIGSKILALALKTNCGLMDKLWDIQGMPKQILQAVEPLKNRPQRIYPEMFDTPKYISLILEDDFMPVLPTAEDDDISSHNNFLTKSLLKELKRQQSNQTRAKKYRTLSGGSAEDLKIAVKNSFDSSHEE